MVDIRNLKIYFSSDSFIYNGNLYELEIRIVDEVKDLTLIRNTDYFISYRNNVDVGTAYASIIGIGNYTGELLIKYSIEPSHIDTASVTCGEADDYGYYDLSNITVSLDNRILSKYNDYTYTVEEEIDNNRVIARVKIIGKDNYIGETVVRFAIRKYRRPLDPSMFIIEKEYTYTGKIIEPIIETNLKENIDYIIHSKNTSRVGSHKVTIVGIGNFTDMIELDYTILPRSIENGTITFGDTVDECYNIGNISVIENNIELKPFDDYQYVIINEDETDEEFIQTTILVYGIENYIGNKTVTIKSRKKEVYAGKKIELDNDTIYPRYSITRSNITHSGTYYLWDNVIVNDKIRICINLDSVLEPSQVVGWIDSSVFLRDSVFEIGDQVIANGLINTKYNGTGNYLKKNNEIMYIVSIQDVEGVLHYGLASAPNRTILCWATDQSITK